MSKTAMMILLIGVTAFPGVTQGQFDPAGAAKAAAPFIDDQTFALVRIELGRINTEAAFDKIIEAIQLPPGDPLYNNLQAAKKIAGQWAADLAAAGGREIYIIFSMADFPGFFCLVPITEDTDFTVIAGLLGQVQPAGSSRNSPLYWDKYERVGNMFFGGTEDTLKRLQSSKPHQRVELSAAFAGAGGAQVQALVLPSADQRRVIEEVLGILPEQIGAGDIKVVTQGVRWIALGVSGPPKMSLKFTVQAPEAALAMAVNDLIARIYEAIRQEQRFQKIAPNLDMILAQFTPAVEGDQVVLALDDRAIETLLTKNAATIFTRAREGAKRAQCASNLRAIARAIVMHQGEYKDQLPATLATLIETEKLPPLSLVCPGTEDKVGEVSYVYRGVDLNTGSGDMIWIHDKIGNHRGGFVNVLFNDMQVKTLTEPEFRQAIAKDNELRIKWGLPEKPIK